MNKAIYQWAFCNQKIQATQSDTTVIYQLQNIAIYNTWSKFESCAEKCPQFSKNYMKPEFSKCRLE